MKFSALDVDFWQFQSGPSRFKACARGCQSGYLFAASLSGAKMVADRHRYAAYHNKHWRRAS